MNFSVIVCPRCRTAKIISSDVKTTTCFVCGKRLRVDKLRRFYEGDKLEEAQRILGLLNARRDGREEDFASLYK